MQVAVVQFSNDVQVEVPLQRMDIADLKKRLDDLVGLTSSHDMHVFYSAEEDHLQLCI